MTILSIEGDARPSRRGSRIRGVWPAIVVDNKDGDGNPGYRVRVKLPWLSDQDTTSWARIAVPMGGGDRGTYVLPEIDDQVLVVFEHGDINRPIVIGTLWSKQQEPVEVNQSGKNNTKLLKSRCGHRIVFDDKQGGESITIVDRTGKNKIVLDSARKLVKIESDGDLEVIAKTNAIIHASALKVGASQGVTLKASSLLVHAGKTLGLKATNSITIGGGTTTSNVANATACNVSGAGSGELGGAAEEPAREAPAAAQSPSRGSGAGTAGPGAPPASAAPAPAAAEDEHQLEVQIVNAAGEPQAGVRYDLTLPDGTTRSGTSGADGFIRVSGLKQTGNAQLVLPDVTTGKPG